MYYAIFKAMVREYSNTEPVEISEWKEPIDDFSYVNCFIVWCDRDDNKPVENQEWLIVGKLHYGTAKELHNKPVTMDRHSYMCNSKEIITNGRLKFATVEIKPPTVKKGTEIEYFQGAWRKRTKTGWKLA